MTKKWLKSNPVENIAPQYFNEDLKCVLCLDIVEEPEKCKACEHFFCAKCIGDWTKEHKDCPSCRANFKKGQTERIVRNMLNDLVFKCKYCKDEF